MARYFGKCWLLRLAVLGCLGTLGVVLWHLVPPQPRCRIPIAGGQSSCFPSHDGGFLFQRDSKHLQIWDTVKGELLQTCVLKRKPYYNPAWYWEISPDDRYVVWRGEDRYMIFDVLERKRTPLSKEINDWLIVAFCGRKSLCFAGEKSTLIVELASGRILREYQGGFDQYERFGAISDNDEFALLKLDDQVVVDHIPTGRRVLQTTWEKGDYHFSPGSRYLVSLKTDRDKPLLQSWDLSTGRETMHLEGEISYGTWGWGNKQHFSPGDGFLLTSKNEKKSLIDLWDLTSGKIRVSLNLSPFFLQGFAFSPDGQQLAVVVSDFEPDLSRSPNSFLRLFCLPAGSELWQQRLSDPGGEIIVNQENEKILFKTVGNGTLVEVFDSKTGRLLVTWSSPMNLAYYPAGHRGWLTGSYPGADTWLQKALLWLGWAKPALAVVDPWTGEQVAKLAVAEDYSFETSDVSQDCRTLIYRQQEEEEYLIYDLPLPSPPLAWVVGPPLVLGLLLALARWRRRRAAAKE